MVADRTTTTTTNTTTTTTTTTMSSNGGTSSSGVVVVSSSSSSNGYHNTKKKEETSETMDDVNNNNHNNNDNTEWDMLPTSAKSLRAVNPVRKIVDPLFSSIRTGAERGDGKDHISLALGDPTASGNLLPCPAATNAIATNMSPEGAAAAASKSPRERYAAGYLAANGSTDALKAVAQFHTTTTTKDRDSSSSSSPPAGAIVVDPESIIIANGCSGALEIGLTALLDSDSESVLLLPQPGFPLYQVIANSHNAAVDYYRLLPNKDWECDLKHIEECIMKYEYHGGTVKKGRVRGIVINNPGNPTGAVFTRDHLRDIVQLCDQYRIPIIADEIYGDLTYEPTRTFHPLAEVAKELGQRVPVLTASGIGKQYILPGWRVGWIIFNDNKFGSFVDVLAGAKRLAQVVLGASHLAQSAIPALLCPTTDQEIEDMNAYKLDLRQRLSSQAQYLHDAFANASPSIPGLSATSSVGPQGAMYSMVRVDSSVYDEQITNDVDFALLLLKEENVLVLPGQCFGIPNVIRLVFCAPIDPTLKDAVHRIQQFCNRHCASKKNHTKKLESKVN